MPEFVRDNAGKAFEFMVEKVDEDRKAAGMSTIAEAFAGETGDETTDDNEICTQHFLLSRHRNFATPCPRVEPCLAMRALPFFLASFLHTSCLFLSHSLPRVVSHPTLAPITKPKRNNNKKMQRNPSRRRC